MGLCRRLLFINLVERSADCSIPKRPVCLSSMVLCHCSGRHLSLPRDSAEDFWGPTIRADSWLELGSNIGMSALNRG
jgi:hypothetical protein